MTMSNEDPADTEKASSNGGASRGSLSSAGKGTNGVSNGNGQRSSNAATPPNEIDNSNINVSVNSISPTSIRLQNNDNCNQTSSSRKEQSSSSPPPRHSPSSARNNANNTTNPSAAAAASPNFQTITITTQDILSSSSSASIVSIVDPWVPRIQNDDEYLHRGLDFSPKGFNNGGSIHGNSNNNGNGQQQQEETYQEEKGGNNNSNIISPVVGDIGAIRLSEALTHNTRLLYLNLSRNDIGNEGGIALAQCLYAPIKTSRLGRASSIDGNNSSSDYNNNNKNNLSSNNISNNNQGEEEVLFRSKTVLRVLNLSHNSISSLSTILQFAQALRYNKSLKELKLNSNNISLEGMVILLSQGLVYNKKLIRLSLVDNMMPGDEDEEVVLSRKEIDGIVDNLVRILCRGCEESGTALEVLEMHNTRRSSSINNNKNNVSSSNHKSNTKSKGNHTLDRDNFHTLSNNNIRRLQCSMYGILLGTEVDSTTASFSEGEKIKNHRFRRLTLPLSTDNSWKDEDDANNREDGTDNNNERSNHHERSTIEQHKRYTRTNIVPRKQQDQHHALRRIFAFNNHYRPILQLHDILNSPLAQAERSLRVPIKLPYYLQRDVHTGALIGLLPSSAASLSNGMVPQSSLSTAEQQTQQQATTSSSNSATPSSSSATSSSKNVGIEYKLMPQVLEFACSECTLGSIWNVIRYRPDICCCCCVGSNNNVMTMVECAPCGSLLRGGDGGCCVS